MTANAGKDADPRSAESAAGAGGKRAKWKRTSAANKPPGDEVTIRTDGASDGSDPEATDPDRAEDTVIDRSVKKVAGKKTDTFTAGAEDTVADIEVPHTAPTGDAVGSTDRLVARGSARGAGNDRPTAWDDGSSSVRSTSLDVTRSGSTSGGVGSGAAGSGAAGSGAAGSGAAGSGAAGSGAASDGAPPYGRAGSSALEPASRPSETGKAELSGGRKPPRKAHLQVARFEPWSVMKFSFIMSLVCFAVLFIAVTVLYGVLSALGVFDALSSTIRDLQVKGSSGGFNPAGWFSAARVLGYTALIGTLNVLLITALATVWSVIYNLAADLVGGVEVTLTEADQ